MIGGVECDNALRKWLARKKYDREVAAGARDGEEEDDDEERPSVALEDDELLYRLFELLCLGGALAQPDLEGVYLASTKALYRDCVRAHAPVRTARRASRTKRTRWRGPSFLEMGTRGPSRAALLLQNQSAPPRSCCSRRRGGCGW